MLPFVTLFIEVSGATVSTVQLKDEGEISIFPTLSLDLILTIWFPSVRFVA
jgi:hypothetical protein